MSHESAMIRCKLGELLETPMMEDRTISSQARHEVGKVQRLDRKIVHSKWSGSAENPH